jgi:hypothetical protein
MTSINKPVRRVSGTEFRFGGKPRRLVVQIGPGDIIRLRESGRRYTVDLAVDDLYRMGVRARVDAEKAARRSARKARRG